MNSNKKVIDFKKYPRKVKSKDINELVEQRRLKRDVRIKNLRHRWDEMLDSVKNK